MKRFLLLLALLPACGFRQAKPDIGALRYRAQLDLRCNDVETFDAGTRTKLVRGCGQEAVYVHQCQVASDRYQSWETDCVWLLDRGPTRL